MRDGITTAVSSGQKEAMRQSRASTWDDRRSLARCLDPAHPYGPTFQDLKPYQYASHPQDCYDASQSSLAGRGFRNSQSKREFDDCGRRTGAVPPSRGKAARATDWGTRSGVPVLSAIDLAGGRDNPGEQGYNRGPVQQGPATARIHPSLSDLKPYSYGGPLKDFRNSPEFTTREEAARNRPAMRGRAARKTDWGTRQGAPVLSDIDLAGGRDNPGEPGYKRGKVQIGPTTARTAPSLADLKPYSYGGQLKDFRNAMGFTTRRSVQV